MQDVVEQVSSDGYAVVRGFLAPADMAEIGREVDRLYQEGDRKSTRLNSSHRH